nr:MAG TPA: restriction alleviation protein [Caudoviricetes sp.]
MAELKPCPFCGADNKPITPAFGIINERSYYGYPVIAICFAWLRWRCKIEIGVKTRWR